MKYNEIITIIKNTNEQLIGKELAHLQNKITLVGQHQPKDANWCYNVYITDNGCCFVTQFGKICGTKKENELKNAFKQLNKVLNEDAPLGQTLDNLMRILKGNK
jgi:hypothetical protein